MAEWAMDIDVKTPVTFGTHATHQATQNQHNKDCGSVESSYKAGSR